MSAEFNPSYHIKITIHFTNSFNPPFPRKIVCSFGSQDIKVSNPRRRTLRGVGCARNDKKWPQGHMKNPTGGVRRILKTFYMYYDFTLSTLGFTETMIRFIFFD